MPRKKSIRNASIRFIRETDAILAFASRVTQTGVAAEDLAWCYDLAIIRLNRQFEYLILQVLVGALNNDSSTLSNTTGVQFPKHMSHNVCRFLVVGRRYFDFRGREGLIMKLKEFLPDRHFLLQIVADESYRTSLEKLFALRNLAAHASPQAEKAARKALRQTKLRAPGRWLMIQGRFENIASDLADMAEKIGRRAPY